MNCLMSLMFDADEQSLSYTIKCVYMFLCNTIIYYWMLLEVGRHFCAKVGSMSMHTVSYFLKFYI
jgi:type III secretory pathway component EscS